MIYILKNNTNNVVLTLTESQTISDPYYIFRFKNEYNLLSNDILFSIEDTSPTTNRYNLFQIIEISSGSTSGGTLSGTSVQLNLVEGQYDYEVYESATNDLIIANKHLLESGRLVVDDINNTEQSIDEIIPGNNNNNENIYD
jgi:hypothetical protein